MKLYGYKKCGTCRSAMKWLDARAVAYTFIDITQTPPSAATLKLALRRGYKLGDLFNRSGGQYRELGMKDKLATMSEADALALLTSNGYLCKRPIVVNANTVTVGFKDEVFEQAWG